MKKRVSIPDLKILKDGEITGSTGNLPRIGQLVAIDHIFLYNI